jgi:cytochrome c biogenesis protein CcmG/thiol:disulfide interchange protein DsbE
MAAHRAKLVAQGIAIGLVALLFILLVWALVTEEGGDLANKAARGELPDAPEFALEQLDEEGELGLGSLRDKAVVVNFWASWCAPCREEAPYFEQVWREERRNGLVVLGLDSKDFRRDARRFVRRYELTFPIVFDGPGTVSETYGVTGYPETFVIDRQGRVVDAIVGAVDSDEDKARLRDAIDEALEACRCARWSRPRARSCALGLRPRRIRRAPPTSRPSSCARSARPRSTSRTRPSPRT